MTTQIVEPGDYLLEVETTRPLSEEMLTKVLSAAGFHRLAGGGGHVTIGAISAARGGGAASMAMGRPGGAPAPAPAPGGRIDRRHFQSVQRTTSADTLIRPRAAVQAPRPKGRLGFVAFHPDTAAVQARTAVSPLPAPEDTSAAPADEGGGGGGGGGAATPGGGGGGAATPGGGGGGGDGGGGGGGAAPGGGGGAAPGGGGGGAPEGGGAAPGGGPEGEGGEDKGEGETAPEGEAATPPPGETSAALATTAAPATESLWTRIYNWLFGKKGSAATVAGWDDAQGWAIVGADQVRRYRLVGQTRSRIQLADIAGVSWKVTQLGSRPFGELVTDGVPAKLCPGTLDMRFLTNDAKIGTRQETVALLSKLGFTNVRLLCLGKRAVKPVGSPRAVLLTEWVATAVWPHKTTVLASGNTMLVESVANKTACAG